MLNLVTPNNYLFISIDSAKVLGLAGAAYCSELLNIYDKVQKKNKFVNEEEFFKVDRKYITQRTTLSTEEQYVIDLNWGKINLLQKGEDPDIIKVDWPLLMSLISTEDTKLLKDIKNKINVKHPRGIREDKKKAINKHLKQLINCNNDELKAALEGWVDTIVTNPNNYMSKEQMELFQNRLYEYTKGDLDMALEIVHIATAQGWKDCNWAINTYEKGLALKNKTIFIRPSVRVTNQKKADSKDDLDTIPF